MGLLLLLFSYCTMHGVALVYTLCRGILIENHDHHTLFQYQHWSKAEMSWQGLGRISCGCNLSNAEIL